MRPRRRQAVHSAALSLAVASTALALAPAPLAAEDAEAKVAKKEEAVRAQIADEVLKVARACAAAKAFFEARTELKLGLAACPDAKKLEEELAKLEGKEEGAPKTFAQKHEPEHAKAHEKCALLLAELAQVCEKEKLFDRTDKVVAAIQQWFPSEAALAKVPGFAPFAPTNEWLRKAEVGKLEAGGEKIDGAWKSAAEVADLDKKHSQWSDPWVLSDDVHELKTVLPYRQARQVLSQIQATRAFCLRELAGFPLKAPSGKLPIYFTATQAEYGQKLQELGGGDPGQAAVYLAGRGTLRPCLATLEPTDGKTTVKITLEQAFTPLRHEVVHQVLFEYLKHLAGEETPTHIWCYEGLANFLQFYQPDRARRMKLSTPRRLQLGPMAFTPSGFAWCQQNMAKLPSLDKFMSIPAGEFKTGDNYRMATVVAYFFLQGDGGAHKTDFLRLCELVHACKATAKSFDECFKGADKKALDEAFLVFVSRIQVGGE